MPADLDAERAGHDGTCQTCGAKAMIPLKDTRLERRPWRIVWRCPVCSAQSKANCPEELVPVFTDLDVAGGMTLSLREVADMVRVSLGEFDEAVADELL